MAKHVRGKLALNSATTTLALTARDTYRAAARQHSKGSCTPSRIFHTLTNRALYIRRRDNNSADTCDVVSMRRAVLVRRGELTHMAL